MFLKPMQRIENIKLSQIINNILDKKYPEYSEYENEKEMILNCSDFVTLKAFGTFFEIVNGAEARHIFIQTLDEEKDEYKIEDLHTSKILDKIVLALLYIKIHTQESVSLFDGIKKGNQEYDLLIENGYDIHNENDMKKLMDYFWNYELNFRTEIVK